MCDDDVGIADRRSWPFFGTDIRYDFGPWGYLRHRLLRLGMEASPAAKGTPLVTKQVVTIVHLLVATIVSVVGWTVQECHAYAVSFLDSVRASGTWGDEVAAEPSSQLA